MSASAAIVIRWTQGDTRPRPPSTALPEYVNQIFIDTNRCIERNGWKQERSQQEQMRDAITSELAQTGQPAPRSDLKATDAFVRGVEERLARP